MYIFHHIYINSALGKYEALHRFCLSITAECLIIVIVILLAYSYKNLSSICYIRFYYRAIKWASTLSQFKLLFVTDKVLLLLPVESNKYWFKTVALVCGLLGFKLPMQSHNCKPMSWDFRRRNWIILCMEVQVLDYLWPHSFRWIPNPVLYFHGYHILRDGDNSIVIWKDEWVLLDQRR